MNKLFANVGSLTKFMFRRERVRIIVWIASLVAVTIMVTFAFEGMFSSDAERTAMAVTMDNPAMIAMVGPNYSPTHYTTGAMMANEMLLFTILAVVIMNIFMVIRHTRRDEERGRLELIRSLPTGHLSVLGATMVLAFFVNAVLAILTGVSLYVLGIASMGFAGSMLYGVALGVSGMLFAVLTALFTQLVSSARGAMGYSLALMGLFYLMRASGDVNNETLACISPLGLVLRTKVYVENLWWPIFVILGIAAVVLVLVFYLNSIRDIGGSFIAARKGRTYASRFLQTTMGLAFRILRPSLIAWAFGVFILGAAYGSVMGDLEGFLQNNETLRAALSKPGVPLLEQFITMLMSILSMLSAIPAISAVLKLKGEENRNHTEHMLTRPISRNRLMGSYVAIALIASVVMQFLTLFGLWYVGNMMVDGGLSFTSFMKSGLVYLPALWIMVGAAVFFVGNLPKFSGVAWGYLAYSFFAVYLGEILQMPEWMARISPFGNIPKLPVDDFTAVPIIIESVIAAAFIILGFVGYGKRDMKG